MTVYPSSAISREDEMREIEGKSNGKKTMAPTSDNHGKGLQKKLKP